MLNKKIFFFKINSIRKKLIFCFTVIIAILISAYFFTYISGKELNNLFNNTLDKHLMLNEVFVNLDSTNNQLQSYLEDKSPDAYLYYSKSCTELQDHADKLEYLIDDTNYKREIVDLQNMIQSYIEMGNQSVNLSNENKIAESNQIFGNAQTIYKLINNDFQTVYSMILQDSSDIKEKVINNRNTIYRLNILLIIFVALLSIFFTRWFSLSISMPIQKLTNAVKNTSEGDMCLVEIKVDSNDEVGILTTAFNRMIKKIDNQISQIKEKAELEKKLSEEEVENLRIKNLLKESELKALQSRINPHFLFNSLNLIQQMAYIEKANVTTSLLESMSDLLRYNLDKYNKVVTLMDEIGNLKDYIFIQQKRFGDRIKFEIIEDGKIGDALIPCLVLQPLVENSIIHGVGKYTENGYICICLYKRKDRIIIKVYDNGIGIDRLKLIDIKKMIQAKDINDYSSGIGINNVFARLNLFYNNDIEADVKSKVGEYTEFTIKIPFRKGEPL